MYSNDYFCEFRSRAFYLDGVEICEVLVFFFKLAVGGWVSLTIGDGVALFTNNVPENECQVSAGVEEELSYPVVPVNALGEYVGKRINRVCEYRMVSVDEGCVGIYFDCGDSGFSVLEENNCLRFVGGVSKCEVEVELIEFQL